MFQRPSLRVGAPRRPRVTSSSSPPPLSAPRSPNPPCAHLAGGRVCGAAGRQPKRDPPALLLCRLGSSPPPARPTAARSCPRLIQSPPRRALHAVSAMRASEAGGPASAPRARRRPPTTWPCRSRAERRGGALQRPSASAPALGLHGELRRRPAVARRAAILASVWRRRSGGRIPSGAVAGVARLGLRGRAASAARTAGVRQPGVGGAS